MSDNRTKTNRDTEQKDKLVERLVAINRVTKVTKGGRTFTFAAIVVVGDEEGRIGFGLGKAGEVSAAIQKGGAAARRNLKQIPLHKGTIPHEQSASFGGARVFLKATIEALCQMRSPLMVARQRGVSVEKVFKG